ncbi:monooxygenase 1-like [Juglans microcarpa x Juglans regia]|uniref:monooxygenase 1-like n=1 Tax=Juglans microcarpa x Juglans regia TaxID=2249226 RepID=UPI001B7EC321|nr:monooxygenase 1-like [Juglans microcarpa x Juglans regia]
MEEMEEIEIVIVGAGICGLATALALHRKGIKSVVLERSESLRASGAGITIRTNGWRCLDQLGVGSDRRHTALPLQGGREMQLSNGKIKEISLGRRAETRCMRRSDLIRILAESLPLGTIHLGYQILSVTLDPLTSYPIIQLQTGSSRFNLSLIILQVLIGCDGANSVVADFLELEPKILLSLSETRGFTNYPSGHDFEMEFFQVSEGDNIMVGRLPIDNKLVYWFVNQKIKPKGAVIAKDPELIHKLTLESIKDFPTEVVDMIRNSERESISQVRLVHRAPWELLVGSFRKGSVTVAGDAMHVMGPFMAQGGSAAIEDGVVLARCLAQKLHEIDIKTNGWRRRHIVGEALDQYVKERRMRLVWLSTQSYLHILLIDSTPPLLVRLICIVLLMLFFSDYAAHTQYDCGRL